MAIKNSSHIKGVTFGDIELKIGQYADDTFSLFDGYFKIKKGCKEFYKILHTVSASNSSQLMCKWKGKTSLNIKKAFDCLEWSYIIQVL